MNLYAAAMSRFGCYRKICPFGNRSRTLVLGHHSTRSNDAKFFTLLSSFTSSLPLKVPILLPPNFHFPPLLQCSHLLSLFQERHSTVSFLGITAETSKKKHIQTHPTLVACKYALGSISQNVCFRKGVLRTATFAED